MTIWWRLGAVPEKEGGGGRGDGADGSVAAEWAGIGAGAASGLAETADS